MKCQELGQPIQRLRISRFERGELESGAFEVKILSEALGINLLDELEGRRSGKVKIMIDRDQVKFLSQ